MPRAKRKWKYKRETRPFWKWFRRRPRISEEFCPECRQHYIRKPAPKPQTQCTKNSAAAMVYDTGGWGRRKYEVHFGRYKTNGQHVYLSDFFQLDDLTDLEQVAVQAREYIEKSTDRKNGRRR